jgi:UDP-galactopyranose mutase
MYDWLIVGAGFTGATIAERIASQLGQKVLLVDKRNHIGGNAYDYRNEHGILTHQYGPHIFHTNAKRVWDYLAQFTEWRPYYHHVLAYVDGKAVPVPFNLNSLYALFPPDFARKLEGALLKHYRYGEKVPILKMQAHEDPDLQFLAEYIYRNVFQNYTTKMWELKPDELDPAVTARVPVYISRDDRYFQDTYQGLPRYGYTAMFQRMLKHPNIHTLLNVDYRDAMEEIKYKRILFTGPIDVFFGQTHGALPYRSLRFEFDTLMQERSQAVGTVNYPNEYAFTRITEQKILTGDTSALTTLCKEYPQAYIAGENDPYYPIPREENQALYRRYRAEADKLKGSVVFAGRLADYIYYNMDQVVARALKVFESEVAS